MQCGVVHAGNTVIFILGVVYIASDLFAFVRCTLLFCLFYNVYCIFYVRYGMDTVEVTGRSIKHSTIHSSMLLPSHFESFYKTTIYVEINCVGSLEISGIDPV